MSATSSQSLGKHRQSGPECGTLPLDGAVGEEKTWWVFASKGMEAPGQGSTPTLFISLVRSVRWELDKTHLTPDITACVKRARIKSGDVCTSGRRHSTQHLRATDRIGDRSRHRRSSRTQTDDGTNPDERTSVPAPSLSVERLKLLDCEGVCCGDAGAIVVSLYRVRSTRSICVRLGREVGQCSGRAADMLKWLQR